MKNKLLKKMVLFTGLLFVLGSVQNLNAQPFPGFNDNVDDETPQAPIDGFVGIALAVGAYFGARKLRNKNNE